MKTAYFTEDNIDSRARALLEEVRNRVNLRDISFDPRKSALIVLDVQRYFADPSSHAFIPSLPPVLARMQQLESAYIAAGRPVILTRHANTDEDAGLLGTWWNDLIRDGTSEGQIVPELRIDGSIVLNKTQYDAFHGTGLEEILREQDVTQVVITGVMTHLCCETTARSAFVRGFTVFLPVDGTATYNEDFHFATLLNLAHGFAVPVLMEDLLKRLEAG
jgi:bifunctional isochorismate lyase/aryl carrier protein